jgi:hypothetical protein
MEMGIKKWKWAGKSCHAIKKYNSSTRLWIQLYSKMSELLLTVATDATVRGTITAGGEHVFSVFNFINLTCDKRGTFGNKVWERLIRWDSVFKKELDELYTKEFVNGLIGQDDQLSDTKKTRRSRTPVMTLRGLQRLLMILGGKVAADFRQIVEGVFTRYISGDLSMIEEIRRNAASDAPIHQAYRQALAQEPVVDAAGTKRILDHNEALFNIELHERQMTLNERHMTLHERSWTLYEKSLAFHRRT